MALHLTADIQEKLKSVLIEEGLVDAEVMQKSEAEAAITKIGRASCRERV